MFFERLDDSFIFSWDLYSFTFSLGPQPVLHCAVRPHNWISLEMNKYSSDTRFNADDKVTRYDRPNPKGPNIFRKAFFFFNLTTPAPH